MAAERMTFTVPADLKKRAQAMRGVNWSGIVTQAIEERLNALELADRIAAKSRLTQADVEELSDLVKDAMAKRHGIKKNDS